MKRAIGIVIVVLVLAMPLGSLAAAKSHAKAEHPKVAAKAAISSNAETMFSRNLVSKIRKGVIAIWAMADSGGALAPAWIGSGFIFQSLPDENAAYALTNHHVAQGTALLQCQMWDNATYKAQLVATEPGIDIALIKLYNIPPDAYEVNVMGDSDQVVIGEPALAMGAPGSGESLNANRSDPMISFGLHETATMRVVTGKDPDPTKLVEWWSSPNFQELGHQVLTNLPWRFVVQSAINGGNSGGPLYNAKGEVIGLNHANSSPGSTVSQNENYTIPINFAKNFADQIINTGKYELPWFGMDIVYPPEISGMAISEFFEKYYDPKVIKVYGVRRDSPASRAVVVTNQGRELPGGLRKGDIIVEFDGQVFPTITDLRLYIFSLPIGKEVPIVVKRDRQKLTIKMTVGVKRNYDSEFSL